MISDHVNNGKLASSDQTAMKSVAVALLCVAMFAIAAAAPTLRSRPEGWNVVSEITDPETETVKFMIALSGQQNLDVLEAAALAVSNPDSPQYQQYWSIQKIRDLTAAPESEQARVVASLAQAGIHEVTNYGDAVEARASVAAASKYFSVRFQNFEHETTGQRLIRTLDQYVLPSEIAPLVRFVTGLANVPVPHLKSKRRSVAEGKGPRLTDMDDNAVFVPATVFNMYQVPVASGPTPGVPPTSQGCYESEQQYYSPKDLQKYAFLLNVTFPMITPATTVGTNIPSTPGDEGQLDVEMIAGTAMSPQNWFWYEDQWMYDFAVHFMNTSNVPSVVSMSYAWAETDQCSVGDCHNWDSQTYVARTNAEFSKMALRGVSVLSASGDSGANGRDDGSCLYPFLLPDYPACSPWVTSVGGTELHNPTPLANPPSMCSNQVCAGNGTEVAISYWVAQFASGGGFSWYSPRPAWQNDAINAYLASNSTSNPVLPPVGYFNASNRAYPDVAALGYNMLYTMAGNVGAVSGTSISTPIFSGLVSLLNEISLSKTGKTLGFVSPLMYKMYAVDATIFHDITVGDNKCTEDGCGLGNCQGYECTQGWDAVTGLGSLNYGKAAAWLSEFLDRKTTKMA